MDQIIEQRYELRVVVHADEGYEPDVAGAIREALEGASIDSRAGTAVIDEIDLAEVSAR